MHILIVPSARYIPADSSTEGVFQQHQAQALKRAGYRVGVISLELRSLRLLRRGLSSWPRGIRVEDDQGIPVFRYHGWHWIPYLLQGQLWLLAWAGRALFRKYVTHHGVPDLVHAHNARFAGWLASQIKQEWRIPYILTEHSSEYARGLVRNVELSYIQTAFKGADKRLVVSPGLGHTLERTVGEAVCPWEWVPNMLDGRFEQSIPLEKAEDNQRTKFYFLNVGSLTENKGHADLLRAFANEFEGKGDVQLRIGGAGPLRQRLELLAKDLGVDRQVSFLGQLSRAQVLAEMQNCDAYVQSSHYETFGVAIIESLACGKPVVATACGGPEYIVHQGNGLLVPARDATALGEAMATVRENVACYDTTLIWQDCVARFGAHTVVNQLANAYCQILSLESRAN